MQVPVSQQPIDCLDVVLDVSVASAVSSQLRQRCFSPENERLNDSDQRCRTHCVPDQRPLVQPS
jgi:hypothetical protein